MSVKYFQNYCEHKWLVSKHVEWLCTKVNNYEQKVHEKASENNCQSDYEHKKECDKIDEQSEGVTWVFVNNKLRVAKENCNFQEGWQEEANRM